VKIVIDDPDQSKFPIGAQGAAAILVDGDKGPWPALRKIAAGMALSTQRVTANELLLENK
jgi:hypothetical protein